MIHSGKACNAVQLQRKKNIFHSIQMMKTITLGLENQVKEKVFNMASKKKRLKKYIKQIHWLTLLSLKGSRKL